MEKESLVEGCRPKEVCVRASSRVGWCVGLLVLCTCFWWVQSKVEAFVCVCQRFVLWGESGRSVISAMHSIYFKICIIISTVDWEIKSSGSVRTCNLKQNKKKGRSNFDVSHILYWAIGSELHCVHSLRVALLYLTHYSGHAWKLCGLT